MLLKLKIKKEIEQEVNIELPIYRDRGYMVYKIESEKRIIGAFKAGKDEKGVVIYTQAKWLLDTLLTTSNPKDITEEEFKEVYRTAMNHIVHEGFLQATEPATMEELNELHEQLKHEVYAGNMAVCEEINED